MFQAMVKINWRMVSVSKALEIKAIEWEIIKNKTKEGKSLLEAKEEAVKEADKIVKKQEDEIDKKQKEIEAEIANGNVSTQVTTDNVPETTTEASKTEQNIVQTTDKKILDEAEKTRLHKLLERAGISAHHKLCINSLQKLCEANKIVY